MTVRKELPSQIGRITLLREFENGDWKCRCTCGREFRRTRIVLLQAALKNADSACKKCGRASRKRNSVKRADFALRNMDDFPGSLA